MFNKYRHQKLRIILFAVFFTLSAVVSFSQDETPTPTPSDTPTADVTATDVAPATETPTDMVVPTVIDSATAVVTAEATQEVTAVTPDATATVDASATTPAPLPSVPLSLVVRELFDDGLLDEWEIGTGWTLIDLEVGRAEQLTTSEAPFGLKQAVYGNVVVEAKFWLNSGSARINVRQNGATGYTAELSTDGTVTLYRNDAIMATTQMMLSTASVWHTLKLSALGNSLIVSVDGVDTLTTLDLAPLGAGNVSFNSQAVVASDGTLQNALRLDDIFIWIPSAEVTPTLVVDSVVTLAPTTTPSVEVIAVTDVSVTDVVTATPSETVTAVPTTETPVATATYTPTSVPTATPTSALVSTDVITNTSSSSQQVNQAPPTVSDSFVGAAAIIPPVIGTGDTTSATLETAETVPTCGFRVGHSVWFNFTPSLTASYSVSTAGSAFDTVLGLYTGSAVDNLTRVVCNDDASNVVSSQITWTLTAGTTYHIQLTGNNGAFGAFTIRLFQAGSPSPVAPLAPILTAPAVSGFTNDNTPTFVWNGTTSTDGSPYTYELQADNSGCTFPSPEINVEVVGITYTPVSTLADGVYCWRVRTSNILGMLSAYSVTRTFTLDTVLPPAPTLTTPANALVVTNAKQPLYWSLSTGAVSYLVDIDQQCDASFEVIDAPVTTPYFTPVTSLQQGTVCWQVQAKDAAGNVSGESARTFTVNILTAPTDNTVYFTAGAVTTYNVSFSWASVVGATKYNLSLFEDNCTTPKAGVTTLIDALLALTKTVSALPQGKYCWKVQAVGVDLATPPTFRKFIISAPAPLAPVLSTPVLNAVTNVNTPVFTWLATTSVGTSFTYDLQVDNSGCTFPSPEINQTGLGLTYNSPTLTDGVYCWRGRTVNEWGVVGAYSATRMLTVDTVAPLAPVLTTPTNALVVTNARQPLYWNLSTGAVSYLVDIDQQCDASFEVTDALVTTPYYTPTISLQQGTICWQVQAKDAAGNVSGESARTFTLNILTAPADNAVISTVGVATTTSVTFTWASVVGATKYNLSLFEDDCTTAKAGVTTPIDALLALGKVVYNLPQGKYCWKVTVAPFDSAPPTFRKFIISAPAPLAPVLSTPVLNAVTNVNTPVFTWLATTSTGGSPFMYELQVDNSGCTFPSPEINQIGLGLTYNSPTLVDGVYCWRVRAVNTLGVVGAYSTTRMLTVDTVAPLAPVLTTPTNALVVTNARQPLYWNLSTGAASYLVDIDQQCDASFEVTDAPVTTPYYVPTLSLQQGTVCWQVQAKDAAGNVSADSARTFTVNILATPSDNMVYNTVGAVTTYNMTFTWASVVGATKYNLSLFEDDCTTAKAGVTTPIDALLALGKVVYNLPQGKYCWKVQAVGVDLGTPPTFRKFVISAPLPLAPVLSTPVLNAVTNVNTPVFTWLATTSTGGSPFTYELQVDNNGCAFPSPEINQTALPLTYTGTTLTDGVYCWRVRAVNNLGVVGAYGIVRYLTIDTIAPLAPVLTTPTNALVVTNARQPLYWNLSTGAVSYLVDIDQQCDASFEVTDAPVTTPYYVPTLSLQQGTVCWQVQAKDAAGNVSAESARTFTVNILATPSDNMVYNTVGAVTTYNVTFTWASVVGATKYNLSLFDDDCTTIKAGYPLDMLLLLGKVVNNLPQGKYCWKVQAVGVDLGTPPTFRKFIISAPAPLAPVLSTPALNAVTNVNTPVFSWLATTSTGGSPFTYELQVDNNGCAFPSPEINQTGLALTYNSPTLTDGVYCWRVRAVNNLGVVGAYSVVRYLTIDTVAPLAPALTTPTNALVVTNARQPLYWNLSTGAVSYLVDIDQQCDASFEVTDAPVATPYYTPTISLQQGTVCWQVQAKDAAGNVSAESARSFTLNILTAPADNALISTVGVATTTNIAFSWASVVGATKYNLSLFEDDCTTPKAGVTTPIDALLALTKTVNALPQGKYCWNVQAVGIDSPTPPVFRKFIISAPVPVAPVLTSPAANAVVNTNTPVFNWADSISTGTPFTYELQVDNSGCTFPSPEINQTGLPLTYTGTTLTDGLYCWRVRTVNNVGIIGAYSAVRYFTVDTVPPAAPTLIAPANLVMLVVPMPTLTWNIASGATSYRVKLDIVSPPVANYVVTTTSFTPPSPLLTDTYYWQVCGLDAGGNQSTVCSEIRNFKITQTLTALPSLNRFANENPNPLKLPPTLTWSPISWTGGGGYYEVMVDNNSTFISPEFQQTKALNSQVPTGTTTVSATGLWSGTWYWRVRACTATNVCGTWSTTGTFTVE